MLHEFYIIVPLVMQGPISATDKTIDSENLERFSRFIVIFDYPLTNVDIKPASS